MSSASPASRSTTRGPAQPGPDPVQAAPDIAGRRESPTGTTRGSPGTCSCGRRCWSSCPWRSSRSSRRWSSRSRASRSRAARWSSRSSASPNFNILFVGSERPTSWASCSHPRCSAGPSSWRGVLLLGWAFVRSVRHGTRLRTLVIQAVGRVPRCARCCGCSSSTLLSEGGRPGHARGHLHLRLRGHGADVPAGPGAGGACRASGCAGERFFRVVFLLPLIDHAGGRRLHVQDAHRHQRRPALARCWARSACPSSRPAGRPVGRARRGDHRRRLAVDAVHVHRAARRARGSRPRDRGGGPRGRRQQVADLPPYHDAGAHPGERDGHPHPAHRGVQDHRPAERHDVRRTGHRDRVADAPGVLRVAWLQPRPVGGDRLHAPHRRDARRVALRHDGHPRTHAYGA